MDYVKLGASFLLASETIKAFPTFSKPLTEVRHIEAGSQEASDARVGYALAIGWSLFVAAAIDQSTSAEGVYTMWFVMAASMVFYYEWAIRYGDR